MNREELRRIYGRLIEGSRMPYQTKEQQCLLLLAGMLLEGVAELELPNNESGLRQRVVKEFDWSWEQIEER